MAAIEAAQERASLEQAKNRFLALRRMRRVTMIWQGTELALVLRNWLASMQAEQRSKRAVGMMRLIVYYWLKVETGVLVHVWKGGCDAGKAAAKEASIMAAVVAEREAQAAKITKKQVQKGVPRAVLGHRPPPRAGGRFW